MLDDAFAARDRLPRCAVLLRDGILDRRRFHKLVLAVELVTDPVTLAALDAQLSGELLRLHGRRAVLSEKQVTDLANRFLALADPDAARRRREDAKARRTVYVDTRPDGMSAVTIVAPAEDNRLLLAAADAFAAGVCAHDPRTAGARRADAINARVTGQEFTCRCGREDCTARPDPAALDERLKRVVIHVIVDSATLEGGDQPGYLDGHGVISADHARDLAGREDAVIRPVDLNDVCEPTDSTGHSDPAEAGDPVTTSGDAAVHRRRPRPATSDERGGDHRRPGPAADDPRDDESHDDIEADTTEDATDAEDSSLGGIRARDRAQCAPESDLHVGCGEGDAAEEGRDGLDTGMGPVTTDRSDPAALRGDSACWSRRVCDLDDADIAVLFAQLVREAGLHDLTERDDLTEGIDPAGQKDPAALIDHSVPDAPRGGHPSGSGPPNSGGPCAETCSNDIGAWFDSVFGGVDWAAVDTAALAYIADRAIPFDIADATIADAASAHSAPSGRVISRTTLPSDPYRPNTVTDTVARFLWGTCSIPGCGHAAFSCDLDHVTEFDQVCPREGGPTCLCNLLPKCRYHHLAKTHLPGFVDELWIDDDGLYHCAMTLFGITTETLAPNQWLFPRLERLRCRHQLAGQTSRAGRPDHDAYDLGPDRARTRTQAKHARRRAEREANRRERHARDADGGYPGFPEEPPF
ncbi:HNH endonuclease [Gordonia sp. PP30]|uniref:HNH endonuclease signature motif containing protein n=1 Tax=Gordonia sp. PP30 TaxID=2935861 RepID=UPI0020003602|nr:HNH endonuclease signature motif containing protein [Gordonia sp. PP30]UQE76313.1 HNH endonuclease [Gordonia sp. PP30]